MEGEYVIVEIIPNKSKRELGGSIEQVSCIKIKDLFFIDTLYLRHNLAYIENPDIVKMLDYGHDYFETTNYVNEVETRFKKYIGNTPLLIMDNEYTQNYLKDYPNEKKSIFEELGVKEHSNVFEELMKLYGIEPTDDLVTILYEALIGKHNTSILSKNK